jgi:hypothetical protein
MSVPIRTATRPLPEASTTVLQGLRPGQRIRVTQTVRVGRQVWTTTTTGVFRDVNYLATGLSTHRTLDDIVVATVHFTKDNGELSSIVLDENSKVELVGN